MTIAEGWVEFVQDTIHVPRSARLRLTRNGLTVVRVTQAHVATARRIANQIEPGLPGWGATGGFSVVPAREGCKPEPDASALPAERIRPDRCEIDEALLPFVVDVVSPPSRHHDDHTEPGHYALRGIPAYLIVDVLAATWTLLTRPGNGAYRCTRSGPFGKEIEIPVADRILTLDSSRFTRVRNPEAGPGRPR
ncbi:Uma2 family endonuclease [Streptomyces sp. NPDC048297]|uniref:Uma2 family endonuclease n=1 Tax=Streptomyces sp. NPDC048297 TaxID=3365531 RepID=UPI003721CA9E